MNDLVRMGLLYELYGAFLTKQQRRLTEAYYYEDLSLSEIAENLKISKQAVSDQLNRAGKKMEDFEHSLGLLQRQKEALALFQHLETGIASLPEDKKRELERILQKLRKTVLFMEIEDS